MAPHSSTLAWKIPWMEEPGGLRSMGSRRVGPTSLSFSFFTFMHWRRKWQPTPVFLPGESQGWGSLVGCSLWGHTESDTTEVALAEESGGEGGGTGDWDGEYMYIHGWFMSMYDKNHYNIVISLQLIKKNYKLKKKEHSSIQYKNPRTIFPITSQFRYFC